MSPISKTLVTHALAIIGTAVAVSGWTATHAIDLYAIWNQLNAAIAAITTLVASVTPIAVMIYGIYRTQLKNRIAEMAADPKSIEAAKAIVPTPEVKALAEALVKNGH